MFPFRIQPITHGSTSVQFDARLLHATRFLQIPEGRAFLLQQLRRRGLPLAALGQNSCPPSLGLRAHPEWRFLAVCAALQRLSLALAPNDAANASPPVLDLDWPQDREIEQVPVYIQAAYTPAPVVMMGNLFETLI